MSAFKDHSFFQSTATKKVRVVLNSFLKGNVYVCMYTYSYYCCIEFGKGLKWLILKGWSWNSNLNILSNILNHIPLQISFLSWPHAWKARLWKVNNTWIDEKQHGLGCFNLDEVWMKPTKFGQLGVYGLIIYKIEPNVG